MNTRSFLTLAIISLLLVPASSLSAEIKAPKGFTSLFNGKDLSNWYGWSTKNPEELWKLSTEEQKAYKDESRKDINEHWSIDGDVIVNDGHGLYLTTEKEFSDYELLIDYKTVAKADSGIYLKGVPQVQIWDYTDPDKFGIGGPATSYPAPCSLPRQQPGVTAHGPGKFCISWVPGAGGKPAWPIPRLP